MSGAFPIDLVLVRHGESEGNLAQHFSKNGDDRLWTAEFGKRHTSRYRLTDVGRQQAVAAGRWIKENITHQFDAYFTSEYVRAMETAAHLGFEGSRWNVELYLREQDRGVLCGKSKIQRKREHSALLERLERDVFYVAAPGGESVANACIRVDNCLELLRNKYAGQRVVVVCHGNIIEGFRVRLEGMTGFRYRQWLKDRKANPKLGLQNGHIIQYSRRNPETGAVHGTFRWMRSVCPYPDPDPSVWMPVAQPTFTCSDLLAEVLKVPQIINNSDADKLRNHPANKKPDGTPLSPRPTSKRPRVAADGFLHESV